MSLQLFSSFCECRWEIYYIECMWRCMSVTKIYFDTKSEFHNEKFDIGRVQTVFKKRQVKKSKFLTEKI